MKFSENTVIILTIGAFALLVSQATSVLMFDEIILAYVGVIYILTAISYEVREFVSFRYAVGVSIIGVLLPALHRLVSVSAARPELAPTELTFVFFQEFVLIPLAAAFIAPLSRTTNQTERLAIFAVIVIPFVVAVLRIGTQGFGFFFNLSMLSLMFTTGAVFGLPLYFYGKKTAPESTSSILGMIH
ncbi:hypothetical protein [Haloparvum sedimenti]|uniref:hypothetical protein n=1 Tax=Haloparvum sedimenti TaxID=1678448 RepID=UPI000F79C998|nr:hypothetical protein [Haloparvum sedimenti]